MPIAPGDRIIVKQNPTAPKEDPDLMGRRGSVVAITPKGYARLMLDDYRENFYLVHPENLQKEATDEQRDRIDGR